MDSEDCPPTSNIQAASCDNSGHICCSSSPSPPQPCCDDAFELVESTDACPDTSAVYPATCANDSPQFCCSVTTGESDLRPPRNRRKLEPVAYTEEHSGERCCSGGSTQQRDPVDCPASAIVTASTCGDGSVCCAAPAPPDGQLHGPGACCRVGYQLMLQQSECMAGATAEASRCGGDSVCCLPPPAQDGHLCCPAGTIHFDDAAECPRAAQVQQTECDRSGVCCTVSALPRAARSRKAGPPASSGGGSASSEGTEETWEEVPGRAQWVEEKQSQPLLSRYRGVAADAWLELWQRLW